MATPTSIDEVAPSILAAPGLYCTLSTCPLELANVSYVPNLAGNILFTSIFGLFLAVQLFLGIRYRTWGFLVGMIGGNCLEIIGYAGRIQMHYNPFREDPFLMYLCCLTIGPAFISASIYLCLARIIPVYSCTLSRFKPRTYTILFITCDFIALLLQAAGGAIASTAEDEDLTQTGIDIMIAGVSWQVFSLGLFAILCLEFGWRIKKAKEGDLSQDIDFVQLRRTWLFRMFLWALGLATLTIFIRSVFRCVELREGFDGRLANDEVTFMVLEGAMIVIAVGSLTFWHPGVVYRGKWQAAGWSLRGRKVEEQKRITGSGDEGNWPIPDGNAHVVPEQMSETPKRPFRT